MKYPINLPENIIKNLELNDYLFADIQQVSVPLKEYKETLEEFVSRLCQCQFDEKVIA